MNKKKPLIWILSGCFLCAPICAARFIEPCEIQFTISDGDIGEDVVLEVYLDDKLLTPEKTMFFEPKKIKVKIGEGIHSLKWKVRKKDFGKSYNEVDTIEKKLEIERHDTLAFVNIRGRKVTLASN